jgi:hypothetical protein
VLTALLVLLRSIGLICRGHRAVALEKSRGANSTNILHFPARVLVIQTARVPTASDAAPGHVLPSYWCGPRFS